MQREDTRLGAQLMKRRRGRVQAGGDPSGSFSERSGSGLSHRRTFSCNMNLDDELAPLEGDMDLPMLALPRPTQSDMCLLPPSLAPD